MIIVVLLTRVEITDLVRNSDDWRKTRVGVADESKCVTEGRAEWPRQNKELRSRWGSRSATRARRCHLSQRVWYARPFPRTPLSAQRLLLPWTLFSLPGRREEERGERRRKDYRHRERTRRRVFGRLVGRYYTVTAALTYYQDKGVRTDGRTMGGCVEAGPSWGAKGHTEGVEK